MITRDDSGAVVLIETDTASVRVFDGVLYVIIDDGQGGEYRGRFDSDLGLVDHARAASPEQRVEVGEEVTRLLLVASAGMLAGAWRIHQDIEAARWLDGAEHICAQFAEDNRPPGVVSR
jgi:hypothetical protein